jgi:hypothetical protein
MLTGWTFNFDFRSADIEEAVDHYLEGEFNVILDK